MVQVETIARINPFEMPYSQETRIKIASEISRLRAEQGLPEIPHLTKMGYERIIHAYNKEIINHKENQMAKREKKQEEAKAPETVNEEIQAEETTGEEAQEEAVCLDRMALEALAKVAGWEPNDPDISALDDEACGKELRENLDILTPEDKATVEVMENGAEIWAHLTGLREDLSKAKIEEGKKEKATTKKAEKKTEKKEKTKAEGGEKKKGPPPREADPSKSNKGQVYLAWKAGETDAEKLHKKINEAVNLGTIKAWIAQWKNGKNLPAVANKADSK